MTREFRIPLSPAFMFLLALGTSQIRLWAADNRFQGPSSPVVLRSTELTLADRIPEPSDSPLSLTASLTRCRLALALQSDGALTGELSGQLTLHGDPGWVDLGRPSLAFSEFTVDRTAARAGTDSRGNLIVWCPRNGAEFRARCSIVGCSVETRGSSVSKAFRPSPRSSLSISRRAPASKDRGC